MQSRTRTTQSRIKRTKTTKTKTTKTKRAKKITKTQKNTYTKEDYSSGDGMLTTVWGPSMWMFLHTMSFNYPVHPTEEDKHKYRNFVLSLRNVLPCKYCRMNWTKNLQDHPLTMAHMKDRESFSRYIYDLHETVNAMLHKKSNLTYDEVKERFEHFRARCTLDSDKYKYIKQKTRKNNGKPKEKGCTEPLYGKKAKCVLKIIPQEKKEETFQMDKKCIKVRA